jgi:predicted nucleotidyltransferase
MVSLDDLRHEKRAAILGAARRHGARSIRVYGSVARGQATDASDLDLLGVTVDVGSERGLHWFIKDEVLREAVPL